MNWTSMLVKPLGEKATSWNLADVAMQFHLRRDGLHLQSLVGSDFAATTLELALANIKHLNGLPEAVWRGSLRATVCDLRDGQHHPIAPEVMWSAMQRRLEFTLPPDAGLEFDCSGIASFGLAARTVLGVDRVDEDNELWSVLVLVHLNIEDLTQQYLPAWRSLPEHEAEWLVASTGDELFETLLQSTPMTPRAESEVAELRHMMRELRELGGDRSGAQSNFEARSLDRDWLKSATIIDIVAFSYSNIWDYKSTLQDSHGSSRRVSKRECSLAYFDRFLASALLESGRYETEERDRNLDTERTSFYKRFCAKAKDDPRDW